MRGFRGQLLIVCVVLFLPILLVVYPPFMDYPNHLVRYAWLANQTSAPDFAEFYQTNWRVMPNLGFDILGVLACKALPPLLAGRLLLYVALVLGGFGFGLVVKKLGGHQAVAFLAPSLLISSPLFLGFNNYVLGMAVVPYILLTLFSGNFLGYVIASLLCFACHGEAAILGVILATVWQIREKGLRDRHWLWAFLVPLVCMAVLIKLGPTSNELSTMTWGTLKMKALLLWAGFKTNWPLADFVWLTALFGVCCYLLASKKATFDRNQLSLGLALLVVAILIPAGFQIAACLDFRIAPMIFIFCAVAIRSREESKGLLALVCVLLFGRSALLFAQLSRGQETCIRAAKAVKELPKDALLFNTMWAAETKQIFSTWHPSPTNLVYYGCLDELRFVSGLFSYPTQQPLLYSAKADQLNYMGLLVGDPQEAFENNMREIRSRLVKFPQYGARPAFVFVSNTGGANPKLPVGVRETFRDEKFRILKIR